MKLPSRITARVRWRSVQQGGRTSGPPLGPQYFPTVVFADDDFSEIDSVWLATSQHFGVAMKLAEPDANGDVVAELRFFAPDLVTDFLSPGALLLVMEGPRAVGEASILSVGDDSV